jgi:hypothetical protein
MRGTIVVSLLKTAEPSTEARSLLWNMDILRQYLIENVGMMDLFSSIISFIFLN